MIRILSIDGGGIRGIIPATILVAFESYLKQYSGNSETTIADYVDLIAGTSTGGILTALYICPDPKNPTKSRFSAQEALDFYLQHGPTIFKKNFLHSLYAVFGLAEARYKALKENRRDADVIIEYSDYKMSMTIEKSMNNILKNQSKPTKPNFTQKQVEKMGEIISLEEV
ncbi:MAG: patatin-like phospholipase family protein, partial [Niameybacter sp.]